MDELKLIFGQVFKRFIGFGIDYFIVLFPNFLITILIEYILTNSNSINDFLTLRCGITYFLYFTYLTYKNGQTIGKKAVGIIVVQIDNNETPNLLKVIIRHLPLTIMFLFTYLNEIHLDQIEKFKGTIELIIEIWFYTEIIFYIIKNNGQMFHDYIAKTTVINK